MKNPHTQSYTMKTPHTQISQKATCSLRAHYENVEERRRSSRDDTPGNLTEVVLSLSLSLSLSHCLSLSVSLCLSLSLTLSPSLCLTPPTPTLSLSLSLSLVLSFFLSRSLFLSLSLSRAHHEDVGKKRRSSRDDTRGNLTEVINVRKPHLQTQKRLHVTKPKTVRLSQQKHRHLRLAKTCQ